MLDVKLAMITASYRPAMARGFAEFVLKQGHGATVPAEIDGKKVRFAGKTWQWVGRELYGQDFKDAFTELVAARKATT